jgi:hypothetical protein
VDAEQETKTKESEEIVRFLSTDKNYGHKFTPNAIAKAFEKSETKIYNKKAETILLLLAAVCKPVFGYEKLSGSSYFWIKAERTQFKTWFNEWFGKEI